MPLDDWQEQALEAAMAERSDGRWAAKFVGISAPRQNGKSQLIVARALAGALLFGEKMIIISAHETDTAREIWKRLLDVIESNPTVESRVTGRMDAINREYISFGTGLDRQTIKLKARRASGSRGFSADCLLLDEAQILGKQSWGSIVPTMSAMPNPQLWLFGTPPTDSDDPYAFARVRASSLAHKARHCWLEWSADPDDDINDPEVWAKANPAYGVRISYEACADDRAAMDDAQFAQERLGLWADRDAGNSAFDLALWGSLADTTAARGQQPVFAVATAPDRSWAAVAVAWNRPDGMPQVELAEYAPGTSWIPSRVAELRAKWGGRRVLADTASRGLVADAVEPSQAEQAMAHNAFSDAVIASAVRHGDESAMNVSVRGARWRPLGDTRVLDRKGTTDISPLVAGALAVHGLSAARPSVYEDRPLLTF